MSSDPTSTESPAASRRSEAEAADPLERLRERVERAASEIERLRDENARLADRVGDLGQEEATRDDEEVQPQALLDGDPAALREKIQQFIDALDRVLAERTASPPSE